MPLRADKWTGEKKQASSALVANDPLLLLTLALCCDGLTPRIDLMRERVTNIHEATLEVRKSARGESDWRCLDLSGDSLGVRIEELPPGSNSSYHHYHTAEEEHILVLEGRATLHIGDDTLEISKGDHVSFRAGEELAHHIENTSTEPFTYLVFGERKQDDVVFYPKSSIALVKSSQGHRWYNYDEYSPEE